MTWPGVALSGDCDITFSTNAPLAFVLAVSLLTASCATSVPRMGRVGETTAHHYVDEANLVGHIKCELHDAVRDILKSEEGNTIAEGYSADWLKTWGAKVSLKLVVEEKFAVAPGYTFNNTMRSVVKTFPTGPAVTVAQSQNTAIGASLGSAATRTETIGFYYAFEDLLAESPISKPCTEPSGKFMEGDLKIREFMDAKILASRVKGLLPRRPGASPYDVFTYQIGFIITSSGNVTPTWKLVYLSANPSTPFLSGSRVQTHDLTLTMGPVKKDGAGAPGPSDAVRDAHLAAMIGEEVARAIGGR